MIPTSNYRYESPTVTSAEDCQSIERKRPNLSYILRADPERGWLDQTRFGLGQ